MADAFSPYAGYDVLAKRDSPSWNEQTRAVIEQRLHAVPRRQFFSSDEWLTLEAVCERLLPQPERAAERVPIVQWIDLQLHEQPSEGFRYDDMPPRREAWRVGLAGIESESLLCYCAHFRDLPHDEQDEILRAIQHGNVSSEPWHRLPPRRFFHHTLLRAVVAVYYAHPSAWSEIGFGGPASPRGYARLGPNQRDPWEAEARRNDAAR